MPENDILIVNVFCAIADPFKKAEGGVTRGLWDVTAGGVKLIIRICESEC